MSIESIATELEKLATGLSERYPFNTKAAAEPLVWRTPGGERWGWGCAEVGAVLSAAYSAGAFDAPALAEFKTVLRACHRKAHGQYEAVGAAVDWLKEKGHKFPGRAVDDIKVMAAGLRAEEKYQPSEHLAEVPWNLGTPGYADATQIEEKYNGKEAAPGLPARLTLDKLRSFILNRRDVHFMRHGRRLRLHKRDWDRAFRKDGKKLVPSSVQLAKAAAKLLMQQQKANKTWDCAYCAKTIQSPTRPAQCPVCRKNTMTMRRPKVS